MDVVSSVRCGRLCVVISQYCEQVGTSVIRPEKRGRRFYAVHSELGRLGSDNGRETEVRTEVSVTMRAEEILERENRCPNLVCAFKDTYIVQFK
jgi:hypothetical protein